MRPLVHAGRRSAGIGGDGRARLSAHAVGVRACGEQVICSVRVHRRFFTGRRYEKCEMV